MQHVFQCTSAASAPKNKEVQRRIWCISSGIYSWCHSIGSRFPWKAAANSNKRRDCIVRYHHSVCKEPNSPIRSCDLSEHFLAYTADTVFFGSIALRDRNLPTHVSFHGDTPPHTSYTNRAHHNLSEFLRHYAQLDRTQKYSNALE